MFVPQKTQSDSGGQNARRQPSSSEQIDVACACDRLDRADAAFRVEHLDALALHQRLARAPRDRPVLNLAPMLAEKAATDVLDALVGKETLSKFCILAPDIREAVDQTGTPEQLGFKTVAPGTSLQQRVDQQLHGVNTVSLRFPISPLHAPSRQQEVVHPPYPGDRIAHAGGDAAAEDRRQDGIRIVSDVLLALDDVNALAWLAGGRKRPFVTRNRGHGCSPPAL